MRIPRYLCIIFAALLVLLAESDACAQWKNVAPVLGSSGFNASHYKDGVLWFGGSALWNSSDTGKTWTNVNVNFSGISVIHFYDKNFGLVGTGNGAYLTKNAGASWTQVLTFTAACRGICFGHTKNEIAVCGGGDLLQLSTDGGNSWKSAHPLQGVQWAHDIYYTKANELITLLSLDSPPSNSQIYVSTDFGTSWNQKTGIVDYDTYSISHDSCNSGSIYVIAEDYAHTEDGISKIFVSPDGGTTWDNPIPMPAGYFSGSVESGINAVYVPSVKNGIYRSTNGGLYWKSIGGPGNYSDSRLLSVINDNIIFACGNDGSIWKTINSGGDSLRFTSGKSTFTMNPKTIFNADTLLCGDSVIRSIHFKYAGCSPPSISSWKISGLDPKSYQVRNLTYDSLGVIFEAKKQGDNHGLLIITLNDGALDTITLNGFNNSMPFVFSIGQQNLFQLDTLALCELPITQKFILKTSGCIPKIISQKIIGPYADEYSITKLISDPLLSEDSAFITFDPTGEGKRNATYELTLSDGKVISIPLQGTGKILPFTYSFTPQSLFDKDTLYLCSPNKQMTITFSVSGCPITKVLSQLITGPYASDYTIIHQVNDSIDGIDSVVINFNASSTGDHTANFVLTFADGKTISIPLLGVGKVEAFNYSFGPQSLFEKDSIYLCAPNEQKTITLSVKGCPIPKVISQILSGVSASDYTIIHEAADSITGTDSVIINFNASTGGLLPASFILTFADGSTISIPLQGYGIAPHPLSILTSNQSTDTIGGSIYIPITISGLDHNEDIELVLHYEKDLKYEGSFSGALDLDMKNEQWDGRSKLHIAQAKNDVILGYAKFDVFGDSNPSHVTFDSVIILTAKAPCQYILPASATSTITPPSGCGIQTLTHFLRDSSMPQLSIVPNPTSGEVSVSSTVSLGDVNIGIYDMLGVKQNIIHTNLQKNIPAKILLPAFNGVYNLQVQTMQNSWNLRAMVNH